MAEQCQLFSFGDNGYRLYTDEPITKHIREVSDEAQYDKFYSLFAFDEIGYHKELKKIIKQRNLKGVYCIPLAERKEIREKFYVRDIYGDKMPKSDEKHIFFIKVLHNIYNEIYSMLALGMAMYEDITELDGLLFYQEELQAEIDGFQMKSIRIRLKAHIELLRRLRRGYTIKESVKKVRKRWLNGD